MSLLPTLATLLMLASCEARFDDSLNFRDPASLVDQRVASLCARGMGVINGSIELKDVLKGLHLTTVTILSEGAEYWFYEPRSNTGAGADPRLQTGFHAELMHALARRGGFSFEIVSVPNSSFAPELTYTEMASVATTKYDLSLDWWLQTPERLKIGLRWPFAFMDLSVIAAKRATLKQPSFWSNFLSFGLPFDGSLWLTIIGVVVVTALVLAFVEHDAVVAAGGSDTLSELSKSIKNLSKSFQDVNSGDRAPTSRRAALHEASYARRAALHKMSHALLNTIASGVYDGFLQFTGAGGFNPITVGGKLLVSAYSFTILVVVAAYTANLASLLVVQAQLTTCASVKDCLANGERFCVQSGTASETIFNNDFGKQYGGQIHQCGHDLFKCLDAAEANPHPDLYRRVNKWACHACLQRSLAPTNHQEASPARAPAAA